MPKLAAFPKGFMDELCIERSMNIFDWISLAADLGVEGLEFYPAFLTSYKPEYLKSVKSALADHDLVMPMFCYSPDFTQPQADKRKEEIDRYKEILDVVAYLGGETCRVLSGQAYPKIAKEDGVRWTVECIQALLPDAAHRGIQLVMENHYKDNYWEYPEFAQKSAVFWEIVSQIKSQSFGVNYDPSNAIIAEEDPLTVLELVKERVVTMHASDRHLKPGYTWDDVRRHEGSKGYADALCHGVIGQGLNDYDAIFQTLKAVGFDGWISIEDGENGMDDLHASVAFLRAKIDEHF